MSVGILTDLTKCIGCEACSWACKDVNELPRGDGAKKLNSNTWTAIERHGGVSVRRQCMHCLDPACVSVCPVAALEKTPEGPVIYHEDRCIGCRYCMIGCPFSIPTYQWEKANPLVQKCIFCAEKRLKDGRQPACTEACPTGATIFGNRDKLLGEAHKRIASQPTRYVDHIYGETEVGGTSVLYLSALPFARLGFKTGVMKDPYPRLTWNIITKLPKVLSIGGVLMMGIWWIIQKRDEMAALKKPSKREDSHHAE